MRKKAKKSQEDWRQIIQEYEESGLTLKEFSKERGVNTWSLRDWRKRLGSKTGAFVEVALPGGGAEYSIQLRNGRELRVSGAFSEKRVRQLIEVLERC